jgi:hypothetical protein
VITGAVIINSFEVSLVRFLRFGLGLNIALLSLTVTNLSAVATTPPTVKTDRVDQIESTHIAGKNQTVIQGNGVRFSLPSGFQGGSPTSAQTKTLIAETVSKFPSMASFAKILDSDPTIIRAIATNPEAANPSIVLISRLPVPATTTLKDLQSTMAATMPAMLPPEFKLVDNRVTTVGSRQIVKMTVDINMNGLKIRESIGLFKEGKDTFQVTYVYSNDNSAQAMLVFAQIMNTFKAIPATTSPTAGI